MRIAVSLFLLLPLIAEATRDESNWSNVKSYNEAVRRHPVNPNAISQVDSDDETRAVAYYYMIVNGTTIDREVRYFLAPYQVSAVGDLHIFFLPGPLANWARNIGSFDIDPSEILERYPPVSLNDLPPMPRMIRRKIRELTYGYDLLRSSGVSREKYGRERASNGATRVQSVDNSVATTVAPQFRPTRMIAPARQTVKPQQQPVISRRKFVPKFDRDEQSIFESIVNELVEHNESTLPPTKPSPKPTNSKVVRIGLGPATVARPLHRITTPKFKPTTPTAPPTADAALKEFTFRPHSTPSSRSVNEYDEEGEEKGETDDIPHSLPETKHLPSKKPSLDSDTPTRITHPRTHAIERNRIKEIIVGVDDARPPIQQRPAPKKRVEEDALSSAEIIEKLSTIRSLQAELERQLELKGKIGRKRVEAAHPDPNLIDLEDLSAPTRTTQEATEEPITTETTTEQPETTTMTTTEAPTTTTRRATTTTTTTHAPTTTRTTTRRPNTTTRPVAPPPLDEQDDVVPAAPPRDTEFHAFHEDLVGALESLDEDPQILPPLPSELFSGHSTHGSFFGGSERRVGQNERQKATTTTRRPTTMRTTTRRATTTTTRAPTTTTTTTEPTTTTTEATTEATTEVPSSTPFTLPTRKFVFVTQPPNTRAPTTTTTTTTTTTPAPFPTLISSGNALAPTVPEFVLDEASESSASPDDVKIDLRTLRALTSLSNDEIDKIRKRFVEVDARATAVKLAPGRELDEAMFRGLEMMEDFEARAQGATTLDEAEGGGVIAMEDLAPMSRRFVPMGMGGRLATAAAVKTKNMDVEYDYVEEKQGEEEDEKNPGRVLVFDDEMGAHVRDSRRIRLQHLNEPLRRFEKVNNGRRDKFVFVRPDRFYDKDGVELQKTKGINEAQLAEAIGLGSGRLVKIVSNDLQPNSHQSTAAEHSKTTTSAPLIGVPIHIAAVSLPSTRKLTPPPVSTTASPLGTRAQPHPPAHTPPVHLLPEQLQLLQLASARPVQQPKAVAVQIPSFLTPPPRPVQQVQQPLQPTVSTLPNIQPVHLPTQPTLVQPVQQQQQNSAAVQQVVTPPPQLAQVVFNQQPVAARVQTVQQPAAAAATTTVPPTTAAATVTTVQLSTVTSSQLQTTTTTPATTTTAAPAAAVTSAVAAPTPSAFLPNPAFRNPIHPSIPFTPALNGLSVNQFLAQFAAQQQAIRAAAKQLQQLQRTPKAVQQLQQPGAQQVQPVLQQQQQQFFWAPQPQFVPAPWFFPGAFGSKTARAGRPPGDVITVTKDTVPSNGSTSKPVVEIERP